MIQSPDEVFSALRRKRVLVVGAGIQGLATGTLCALAGAHVSIVGERVGADTTSAGAAAFWRPYFIPGTPEEDVSRWSGMTMALFRALLDAGVDCGLQYARGTELSVAPPVLEPWTQHAIDVEVLTPEACASAHGPAYRGGLRFTSVVSDPTYFMPLLRRLLARRGAVLAQRAVQSLRDEATCGRFDAVFNCAGLGAGRLARDPDVIPVRGQVLKAVVPAVHEWIVDMDGPNACGYILPRASGIAVLGGTHTEHDSNEADCEADIRGVLERTAALNPAVKGAKLLSSWAGLRPVRTSGVRVAIEHEGQVPIVHNYGHGGSGWTLFWGTAHDAVRLAHQALHPSNSPPSTSNDEVVDILGEVVQPHLARL